MSDAIFIAGYYRSGTSALSGALARLGVMMFNEADPNEHNPLGFYEIPELIGFDVELFAKLGVEWTDIRGLSPGWHERADIAPLLAKLDEILRRRFPAGMRLFGLKHPHLCRTLPLYERAVRQAGHTPYAVHIFREPWVAAASQQRKNGLSRAHALLLWLSYITSAERLARHLPRAWLTYGDLMADPATALAAIGARLGLPALAGPPAALAAAAASLKPELNRAAPLEMDDLARPLRALVEAAWALILARDESPASWDALAAETAGMAGLITELGASRASVIPAFGQPAMPVPVTAPQAAALRPAERLDDAAKLRLLRQAEGMALPSLAILIPAPAGRAAALAETLQSLRGQWRAPDACAVIAADPLALEDTPVIPADAAPGAVTAALCARLNDAAGRYDYVAVLNAGDVIAPDACLRFALTAAHGGPDLIYCDEIVPREGGAWVRHKPGWDVTRLRQSAYLGDWVWYRGNAVRQAGGFDPAKAGAEEYDMQLRLAAARAEITRLPEALFTRAPGSHRDNIPLSLFLSRAADSIAGHLAAVGLPAAVQNRQHPGLFHHLRVVPDPGTAIILLCDGADIPSMDRWLTTLLTGPALTGPVILAGATLAAASANYLTAIAAAPPALEGKVLAVPPAQGASLAAVLSAALARAATAHVAIIDARATATQPHWLEGLRARLADPSVAMAAASGLVPLANAPGQFTLQGPIILGADTRLGAGHLADDPGPGGWLIVDQEASALTPPALLARRAALAACRLSDLPGDALWIDLAAQLRATGAKLVFTPDIAFITPPGAGLDTTGAFRAGTPEAAALPWDDPYHHPALSLQGDLLAPEQRHGLVRAAPADPASLLLTGAPEAALPVLNAARALRAAGLMEASWAPEPLRAAELGRRAGAWLRCNPQGPAAPHSPPYRALFSAAPAPGAAPVIAAASALFATSPGIAAAIARLAPPTAPVTLWRPALSAAIWAEAPRNTTLNTKPRILWIDEGIAPAWFARFIEDHLPHAAWIAVARPGASYPGAVARIEPPADEFGWAAALGAVAPQLMLRPAGTQALADHYPALLAAAAGCHILADDRLDLPPPLRAKRLPNRVSAWTSALHRALTAIPATLAAGTATRAAALALPSLEAALPPWAMLPALAEYRSAAE